MTADRPQLAQSTLLAHPSVLNAARTTLPEGDGPPVAGAVRQVREADGLEPILRLAAAWQRIDEGAIRQTQQGTYFKRDRERLEDDLVLAGPIADAIEPLPDMPLLWVAMARAVGLVVAEAGTDRLVAADPEFWGDNAVHLPQMVATRWLALRDWHEQLGMRQRGRAERPEHPVPPRPGPALARHPRRDRLGGARRPRRALDEPRPRLGPPAALGRRRRSEAPAGRDVLAAILLGPAYQLGLVRTAEEARRAAGSSSSPRWAGTPWRSGRRRRPGRRSTTSSWRSPTSR